MKNVSRLGFWGILSVLTVVVFLVGTSFMQAQGKIQKKPVPPPEATWAVRIPTLGMFYGTAVNGYYENNGTNIRVSVKKESPGAWRKYYGFVYTFDFTLTNDRVGTVYPPAYQVGFLGVGPLYDIDTSNPDQDKPSCQFPTVIPEVLACPAEFLNNPHPYSDGTPEHDYQYFWTRVNVFDKDIELMLPVDTYILGDSSSNANEPGDIFEMVARYREACSPEPAYHDVVLTRNINKWRALNSVPPNPRNIVIERLATYDIPCDGVWRIYVHSADGNITGFLKVQEQYCAIEKNRTKWYYPLVAKGVFDFYIDFIKNPVTQ